MRVRTKRRTIFITVLVCIALALAYAILSRDNEPRYKGKTLSEWLAIYTAVPMEGASAPAETQREAQLAIRSIGTNALPFVLEWMRQEPSPWRETLLNKLPQALQNWPLLKSLIRGKSLQRAERAGSVFVILQTNAVCAIPELETLMQDNGRPERANSVITCLTWIGPAAIPVLTNALANPNQSNRWYIILSLREMTLFNRYGDSYRDACLPALIRAFNDPDPFVRRLATNAVGSLTNEPRMLFDLSKIPRQYEPIISAQYNTLHDPDQKARNAMTNAFGNYAPELLTNAPPQ